MSVLGFFPGGGDGIKLQSIAITTPPTKTAYLAGDTFDPAGMVVTAAYTNGATLTATGYSFAPDTPLTLGTVAVTIRYTEGGVSKTAVQAITVSKESAAVPTASSTLTYTGSTQSPTWSGYDSTKMTIGGTASAVNAGSYTATFTLKDTARCQWADGTTAVKSVTWSIGRAAISAVPSQSGSLTYTGSALSPAWSNYDSGKMTMGGTTSSVNAGTFTATFTPGSNYRWSDGTTTAKSVSWTIAKAAGSLSISPTSLTLDTSNTSRTISVTRAGNGTITATSSNTSVATVSVSGTTVTVRSVNNTSGSATITVKVAAGTNHTAPANKTCAVTASFIPTLNDASWAYISQASSNGQAANYWSVGDRKAVILDGICSKLTFYNQTYYCYILGFDHNSGREGVGLIHFLFGYTEDNRDIAFISGYDDDTDFYMNSSKTNSGGWSNSFMRKTICAQFKNCLPSDLVSVLKTVKKYSDNTGGGSDTASRVTLTTDTIFILAEFEVSGLRILANSAEQNYQEQYQYYKNGNSRAKERHDYHDDYGVYWWLRSVDADSRTWFCRVEKDGGVGESGGASNSFGFAPAFCV